MARAGRFESRYDLVLLAGCAFLGFFVRALPQHLSDAFASGVRRTVLAPLVSLQRQAELTRGAIDTYENRTIALDSLALQAMEARSLAAENDALRSLLALGARLRWGFTPTEALTGASAADEYTLTLTVGAKSGIRPKSPVVAPEGLVGMVQTVDPTMSIAIIWPHPDFRVSAMDADGNAFGIVQAHRDPDTYLLELRGVAFRSELAPGTEIRSSGLGGVYPKGIPIGTVLREAESPEGWTRTYVLLPAVRPQDVRAVMVLDPQRANEGVQHVWATPAARDSVTRRIAAANDSIARRSAALAAAHARADSLLRAANEAEPGPLPTAPATTESAEQRPEGQPRTQPQTSIPTSAAAPTRPRQQPQSPAATNPPRADSTPRQTDSARRVVPPPTSDGDSAQRDSARRDSARRDSAGVAGARPAGAAPDSTRRDPVRPATTPPDTTRRVPPPAPEPVPPPGGASR